MEKTALEQAMINLQVNVPIYFGAQLDAIADASDGEFDRDTLYDVMRCTKGFDVKGDEIMLVDINTETFTGKHSYLLSGEALSYYIKKKGLDIKPVSHVTIPYDVYNQCDADIWYDICYIVHSLVGRLNRYEKLVALDGPTFVIEREKGLIFLAIEALEDSTRMDDEDAFLDKDGYTRRSLSYLGYSLLDGWADYVTMPDSTDEDNDDD